MSSFPSCYCGYVVSWVPQPSPFNLTPRLWNFPLPTASWSIDILRKPVPNSVSYLKLQHSQFIEQLLSDRQQHKEFHINDLIYISQEPSEVVIMNLIFWIKKLSLRKVNNFVPNFSWLIIVCARIWIPLSLTLKHYGILTPPPPIH